MAPVGWSPFAAAGIAVGMVAWLLAFLVYRTDPSRRLNQLLALLLVVEGANIASGNAFGLSARGADAYAWTFVHAWMDGAVIVAYLLFIGRALDTPLVRPFRSRAGQWILGTLFVGFSVFLLANPTLFIVRPLPFPLTWYSPWTVQPGTIWPLLWLLMAATSLFGLVSAIHAWRRARVGPGRRQALTYVVAFGTRDVGWFGVFLSFGVLGMENPWTFIAMIETHKVASLAYLLLLTYGFLKTQLFDIDLRIKRGISRSTVAGAFAVAFFVASEGIEQVLAVDGTVFGMAAAGLVALALSPLRRGAQGLADRLMPGVEDSQAYRIARKHEVYQASVASAMEDGWITEKEDAVLETLRTELGIEQETAQRLRSETLAAHPPA